MEKMIFKLELKAFPSVSGKHTTDQSKLKLASLLLLQGLFPLGHLLINACKLGPDIISQGWYSW